MRLGGEIATSIFISLRELSPAPQPRPRPDSLVFMARQSFFHVHNIEQVFDELRLEGVIGRVFRAQARGGVYLSGSSATKAHARSKKKNGAGDQK